MREPVPSMLGRSVAATVFVSLLLSSRIGEAEEFEEIYHKGVSLYEKEMYSEAAQAFRDVYALRPDFQYLFNIGQCEFSLRRFDLALEAFSNYLKDGGDQVSPERREYVNKVIEKTQPLVGYLEIKEPETFDIWVDNRPRGATPLSAPLFVMGGEHTLVLKSGNQTIFKKQVTVNNGETVTVERPEDIPPPPPLESAPAKTNAPEEEETKTPAPTAPSKPASPLKPVGITLASVGGAVLISGIVTGAVYLSKRNTLEDNCPTPSSCQDENKSTFDTANALATVTNVLIPVGGFLAVTGAVLTIVGSRHNAAETEKQRLAEVAPYFDRDAAGVVFGGRF